MKPKEIVFLLRAYVTGVIIVMADADCGVIPMTEWAGEASLITTALPNPVDLVIIQHTVSPEPTTDQKCVHVLKAIRKYHRETMGFDDIGENCAQPRKRILGAVYVSDCFLPDYGKTKESVMFLTVCGNGKVYEGAGWGHVGAHTKSFNSKSIGISFMGEFDSHLPDPQALIAARDLISCGVSNGHLAADYKLIGHRQVSDTISPGAALQKEIQNWPHWSAYH